VPEVALPRNTFKHALAAQQPQIGLWVSIVSSVTAEIVADAGFDWLLLDMEHSPNDMMSLHGQLSAVERARARPESGGAAHPIVRPPWNDTVMIKRLLDVGVQTLLIPFVETAEQAAAAVAATRYPPAGVRGVSASARSSAYGRVANYLHRAADELCVLVQVESRKGYENLEAIARTPGVDGVFIGPQDFAAGFGHLGNPGHPEVRAAIEDAITRIRQYGKAPGILAPVEADAQRFLALGALFVAVGSDNGLLSKSADALAKKFKP
jgi:4-hydroxy-2-oxoheptanedioate aldolase